jgi:hypothetical protein
MSHKDSLRIKTAIIYIMARRKIILIKNSSKLINKSLIIPQLFYKKKQFHGKL